MTDKHNYIRNETLRTTVSNRIENSRYILLFDLANARQELDKQQSERQRIA